jgi:hypothetical protein
MQSMQWTETTRTPAVLKLRTKSVFFPTFESNLPFLFFVGVLNIVLLVLAMVSPKNECLGATVCLQRWRQLHTGRMRVLFVPVSIEGHTTNGSVAKRY